MATITLKGTPYRTVGELPATGTTAPDFALTRKDLTDVTLADYSDGKLVLNIFPSLDTPVCANSVRAFNKAAADMENTRVLCISADLPFAHERFCETEGIKNVENLSTFRSSSFGKDYGIAIADGPLAGLMARAVLVLDPDRKVIYVQLVPEIAQEPDYEAALGAVR